MKQKSPPRLRWVDDVSALCWQGTGAQGLYSAPGCPSGTLQGYLHPGSAI